MKNKKIRHISLAIANFFRVGGFTDIAFLNQKTSLKISLANGFNTIWMLGLAVNFISKSIKVKNHIKIFCLPYGIPR